MLDLMLFAFLTGFAVSIAPGLVNLIAFEQVLNTSFRAGWAVALGGTTGQGIFVTAVLALYVFSGDAAYIQATIAQVEAFISVAKDYNHLAAIAIGALILLGGVYYLRKKDREEEHTGAGFILGMVLTLFSLDYMITYATIYGVKTDGYLTLVEAAPILLANIVGIHTCWFGKLALVQVFKNALIKFQWTDFNKITGWFLILVGLPVLFWGLFTF